ncbi:MAG: hypothetical protein J7L38_07740 [Thermoproteales archaeon]|nr:hypothetical protein [Thermoproteales archaeon]RLE65262.1 MAG: hypothetical protein DRJ47_05630 [Thermoprotei archaeon]
MERGIKGELDEINILVNTLKRYLQKHGKRILTLTSLTNQRNVRVEVNALFRYFLPTPEYDKLEKLLEKIPLTRLEEKGIKLIADGKQRYFVLSTVFIRRLMEEDPSP